MTLERALRIALLSWLRVERYFTTTWQLRPVHGGRPDRSHAVSYFLREGRSAAGEQQANENGSHGVPPWRGVPWLKLLFAADECRPNVWMQFICQALSGCSASCFRVEFGGKGAWLTAMQDDHQKHKSHVFLIPWLCGLEA